MSDDPRHALGRDGERLAAEHLQRLGFTIVGRNYRTREGELDLIAYDGSTLAFCEVKSRRSGRTAAAARPLEAIGPMKQRQVRRIAMRWLARQQDRPYARHLRFDAIGLTFDDAGRLQELEHLQGVF